MTKKKFIDKDSKPNDGFEYDDNGHNLTWIRRNHKLAKEFAEQKCPWKIINRYINKCLEDKTITPQEAREKYNLDDYTFMRIDAEDTRIEFTLLWAKNENKPIQSYPLQYEYDFETFEVKLYAIYNYFKNKLDTFTSLGDKED